jgi:molybdenum cofactor biosynthesis enzyme MoaA
MACQYCPRFTSMEDYTPAVHRGRGLTHERYRRILRTLLSTLRFTAVSLTGGEPLMNPHLPDLAATARPLTDRLELNTNGLLVTATRWARLAPLIDRVKLSLDTIDPALFKELTEAPGRNPLARVLSAIDVLNGGDVELALNCVVSRSTLPGLEALLEYAAARDVRLHLLDYYYTPERRENWQREFVPIESLMPSLRDRFGEPEPQPIFGCGFHEYRGATPGSVVRIKTSFSGTMRAPRCAKCPRYCQEGMYGLKLSTDGWLTTCPSTALEDGVLLHPDMAPADVWAAIAPLVTDLAAATHDADSMATLIDRHGLIPAEMGASA